MRIEIEDKKQFVEMFNILYPNNKISNINGLSIDSRKITKGDIFFPIKGNKYDGHKFITKSLGKGAIISFSKNKNNNKKIITVKSIKNEINKLAKNWLKISKSKIIGITGSNGKTTAKNLLYHILSNKYKCNKTIGNYNSLIGFPLSFLASKLDSKYNILEYGASKPHEIKKLCEIISPDYSLITNVSNAHIKNYKSFDQLYDTKYEIYSSTKSDGTIFINTDQFEIKKSIQDKRIKSFRFSKKIKIENNYLIINNKKISIPEEIIYLKDIILSIYIITHYLGITNKSFENSLKSFNPSNGRGNYILYKNHKIIDDSYNANPNSVNFAINRFSNIKNIGKKIFILGDMLELGDIEIEEHNKLAKSFNMSDIDVILTYGKISENIHKYISKKKYSKHYYNKKNLKIELNNLICKNDIVYLKGSRSMKLESLYKGDI